MNTCYFELQHLGCTLNTLACGRFWGFPRKNTETHVALHGNFSGPVSATDLVKVSKDAASLVACTQKNVWLEGADFL